MLGYLALASGILDSTPTGKLVKKTFGSNNLFTMVLTKMSPARQAIVKETMNTITQAEFNTAAEELKRHSATAVDLDIEFTDLGHGAMTASC
jgi:hypothetical protein